MDSFFDFFSWSLKFLSYLGIVAGFGTGIMLLVGGFGGTKNPKPQGSSQGFGLILLGIWMIFALIFVLSESAIGIIVGQASFAGYGFYLFFWDSRKDKARSRSRIVSLVFGALLLMQPANAGWVYLSKLLGG